MAGEKKKDRKNIKFLVLVAVSAFVPTLAGGIICELSDKAGMLPLMLGVALAAICEALVLYFVYFKHKNDIDFESENGGALQKLIVDVLGSYDFPVIIANVSGKIVWFNKAFNALNEKHETELEPLCGRSLSEINLSEGPSGCEVEVNGKQYSLLSYIMPADNMDFWMVFFSDRSELAEVRKQIDTEFPVVVYAVLDNTERLSQLVRSSFRSDANEIEKKLGEWAASLDGFIREYDRDKFMIIFPNCRLPECRENGFSIIDEIRALSKGDNDMKVTVSMGISNCGNGVREREADAAAALETALQRGGDQVVLRERNGSYAYYGGKTNSDLSRTRIASRTVCHKLTAMIGNAGNVIIMGHSNPDFDSIGGCVGLCRLAMTINDNVRIVIDKNNPNFLISTAELLEAQPEYEEIFISGEEGMDLIRSDTLLIVADVNNMKIVECPEIAQNVATQVVIDHHRKISEFDIEPKMTLIEPGTSSTCELVSEMLELATFGDAAISDITGVTKHEANIMLAGIMLDTKNFTRSTGEETFASALFLKAHGANTESVRTFFFSDEQGFVTEARLSANTQRFHERIAIAADDAPGETITPADRIAASKTAETLLSVRGTDAAFVLMYSGSDVLISGRSNGTINVQLILEKLGGGGRYDAAGAQLKNRNGKEVTEELKKYIEEYLVSLEEDK